MDNPEAMLAAAEAAARSARRVAALALIAVAVAAVVLAIDQGIKRAVIAESQRAREILDEFKLTVVEAASGIQGAGPGAADSSADHQRGNGLVHDPGIPEAADPDESRPYGPAHYGAGRHDAGPRGDE